MEAGAARRRVGVEELGPVHLVDVRHKREYDAGVLERADIEWRPLCVRLNVSLSGRERISS